MLHGHLLALFYARPINDHFVFFESGKGAPFLELLMCLSGYGAASSKKVDKNRMFLEFDFSRGPFCKNTLYLTFDFHLNGLGGFLRGPRLALIENIA